MIEQILVSSFIPQQNFPKHLVLNVDATMTLWELIDLIARKLDRSPLQIQLRRSDMKKPELTPISHSKTLADLKFEKNDEVTVLRNVVHQEKVPLINPLTDSLVREVRMIFSVWFDTFSTPKEEFEDAEQLGEARYMTKMNCLEWLNVTIPELHSGKHDKIGIDYVAITNLFTDYDTDGDDRLTKADFLAFYTDKSRQKPDLVWANLHSHNIGKDLHPEP